MIEQLESTLQQALERFFRPNQWRVRCHQERDMVVVTIHSLQRQGELISHFAQVYEPLWAEAWQHSAPVMSQWILQIDPMAMGFTMPYREALEMTESYIYGIGREAVYETTRLWAEQLQNKVRAYETLPPFVPTAPVAPPPVETWLEWLLAFFPDPSARPPQVSFVRKGTLRELWSPSGKSRWVKYYEVRRGEELVLGTESLEDAWGKINSLRGGLVYLWVWGDLREAEYRLEDRIKVYLDRQRAKPKTQERKLEDALKEGR